jgi:hypothetical protein
MERKDFWFILTAVNALGAMWFNNQTGFYVMMVPMILIGYDRAKEKTNAE